MNKNIILLLLCLFAMGFTTAALAAPNALNHDQAVKLVKGNTAVGTNAFGKKMSWYFADSGVIYKADKNGRKKGKASWSISSRGELCYQDKHMNDEKCAAIIPQGDGKYEVLLEHPWKWDKVIPGNLHKL